MHYLEIASTPDSRYPAYSTLYPNRAEENIVKTGSLQLGGRG